MMNVLALGLVLTSLVTAGFFTSSPENQKSSKDDVIIKEGHRVVVVEFDKDDRQQTKVLISPPVADKGFAPNEKGKLSGTEDVKDKSKEASSSSEKEKEINHHGFRPRELVCDAYGKCKHKIASAFGTTKEKLADKANEVEQETKDTVSDAIGNVKDAVTHTAHHVFDGMRESKEAVKDSAIETKDKITHKASEIKEGAKEKAHDVIDTTKKVKQEVEKNASRKLEETDILENTKQGANRVRKEGQKEFGEIMHQAREVGVDFFDYVFSPDRLASLSGVLHLMGFGAAYGMCVWITFASSYVLAEALPRNQFAMVQSKIYPVYFKAMAYSVGVAILGHMMNDRNNIGSFHGFNLLASLVMILVNLLVFEPRATTLMLERMKKEKEEGMGKEGHATEPSGRVVGSTADVAGRRVESAAATKDGGRQDIANSDIVAMSEKLRKLNSYSSFLNVLTLMSLTWHLVHLGQRLHAAC